MPGNGPRDRDSSPLVSVVCTAYNRGAAIRPTLRSVLAQEFDNLELIVVSDGSTDDTNEHVQRLASSDPRVQLVEIDNGGAPRAMNIGVEIARGEYIAYIDHDDVWTPEHLRLLIDELELGADLVASGSIWMTPEGEVISTRPSAALFWHPDIQVINPVFENSQAMHRSELMDTTGPWREEHYGLEDWDLWLRMTDAGARVATIVTPTVHETMGATNRYRSLPKNHSMELARCPDVLSARKALRALGARDASQQLAETAAAEMTAWYEVLANDDRFVFPRGFAPSREEAIARVPDALRAAREADRGLEDPVSIRIEPRGNEVAIVRDLECMTARHAERYAAVWHDALPRYHSLLADLVAPFGVPGHAASTPPADHASDLADHTVELTDG